eukprot:GSChrysophyteH1.ASY1.ANO1.1384.1 assembled CDS
MVSLVYFFVQPAPPSVSVEMTEEESAETLQGYEKFDYRWLKGETREVHLFDPSTLDYFGSKPAMGKKEVDEMVRKSREAQKEWSQSSFAKRRLLMRTMQRCIVENQENCARVAVRESGKTMLDALIGEVLVTCEKLSWLASSGEQYLQPESRSTGRMMIMKKVRVEWVPMGVIGAIVPWNYPFHNVFNPVSAALFSGNSIIIKVSEYASWSIDYYKRIIDAWYGEAGSALVSSGVDKIIFVGSPEVGAIVARNAAATLTPVVLELGGKDPFVVCDDVDVASIVQTACRGVWQNMGQNCAGPERFFVYESVYDSFCDQVTEIVKQLKTGPSLGDPSGSFYPPTVLADVPENARIAQEEIFGPIMCIFCVEGDSDEEAARMANNCEFALSSCAFSGSAARAEKVASSLNAGMSAVNDLEGCTYMSQSLPFGGRGKSGYDRFAGPEGLRGLCMPRSICEDRFGFIRNSIPPPMHYPSTGIGAGFAQGLIHFFYNTSLIGNIMGIASIIANSNPPKRKEKEV